jgi:hypothetical protein
MSRGPLFVFGITRENTTFQAQLIDFVLITAAIAKAIFLLTAKEVKSILG